jgi:hypothetical protein
MPSTKGFAGSCRGVRDSTARSPRIGLPRPRKTGVVSGCGGEDWMQGGAG